MLQLPKLHLNRYREDSVAKKERKNSAAHVQFLSESHSCDWMWFSVPTGNYQLAAIYSYSKWAGGTIYLGFFFVCFLFGKKMFINHMIEHNSVQLNNCLNWTVSVVIIETKKRNLFLRSPSDTTAYCGWTVAGFDHTPHARGKSLNLKSFRERRHDSYS